MDLDRTTLKALASDSRADILKNLTRRRMLPSELAKSLDMAPSTVVEHLKVLEQAGLVARKPSGPKWVYYEITQKGNGLLKPAYPMRIILSLTAGAVTSLYGASRLLYAPEARQLAGVAEKSADSMPASAPLAYAQSIDYLAYLLLAIGIIIMALSVITLHKSK